MNALGGPSEIFASAAQTVLGRALAFCGACSLGGGVGVIAGVLFHQEELSFVDALTGFGYGLTIVPFAMLSIFVNWGLFVYPACIVFGIFFIRLDISFRWLLLPFGLVALDTATINF